MLVDAGIDSISLNPDSVLKVRQRIAKHEEKKAGMKSGGKKVKSSTHTKQTTEKAAKAQ
jgi:phosphoenolpyruvate-protein kinase (PTS system EI component)